MSIGNFRIYRYVKSLKCVGKYIYTTTNPSPSLPIPVGLNFLFLNFDSKILKSGNAIQ